MSSSEITGFSYLKTFSGVAKVAELVLEFSAIISVAVHPTSGKGDAFLACTAIAFFVSAFFLVAHVAGLTSKIGIPWDYIEFATTLFCNVLLIIVSALIANVTTFTGYSVGGAFGFIAAFVYEGEAIIKFKNL
ncbi:hypothetical protein FQR65_LT03746 [Abscondita terminalis]|nr:hypothetical protein FQR65_LT03746 [Abscondita terminalis]